MTSKQVLSQDDFVCRTVRAFLDAQRDLYAETIKCETDPEIIRNQAEYEVALLVATTVARWISRVPYGASLREPMSKGLDRFHDAICKTGDNHLQALGYVCEDGEVPHKP